MNRYETLTSSDDLEPLLEASHQRPVVIFKHSLTCPISSAALRRYRAFLEDRDDTGDDAPRYTLLEVQNSRELSNRVAEHTGVRHESPQALVLRGGEVSWHASHGSITGEALGRALARS